MQPAIITPDVERVIRSLERKIKFDPKRLRVWLERFARETYREPGAPQAQARFSCAVSSYVKSLRRLTPGLISAFVETDGYKEEKARMFVDEFRHFLDLPLGEAARAVSQFESELYRELTSHSATRLNAAMLKEPGTVNAFLSKFVRVLEKFEPLIGPLDMYAQAAEEVFVDHTQLMQHARERLAEVSAIVSKLKGIAQCIVNSYEDAQRRSLLLEFRRTIVSEIDPFHGIREGLEDYAKRIQITSPNRIVNFPNVIAMRDALRSIIRMGLGSEHGKNRLVSLSVQSGEFTPLSVVALIAEPSYVAEPADQALIPADLRDVVDADLPGLEIGWLPATDGAAIAIAERQSVEQYEPMSALEEIPTMPRFKLPANATPRSIRTTQPYVAGASTFVRKPTELAWRPGRIPSASGLG